MSEATMIELAQGASDRLGIEDDVVAVGQFNPRGPCVWPSIERARRGVGRAGPIQGT